jgi:hypothetical protein
MLKMRIELLKIDVSLDFILDELRKEIITNEKIKKADFLIDKINSDADHIGFQSESDDDDDDDDDDLLKTEDTIIEFN